MYDGRWDPEQLERGYRYFKALEHQRRGYVVIRERVRDFLWRKRWEIRQPEAIERAALELVDELATIGALALYQCGVNDENWRDYEERRDRRRRQEVEERIRAAANQARDEEQRRVEHRLAELEAERAAELYAAENRRKLELEEKRAAERRGEVTPIVGARRT
jgi:hypothetical protein